MSLQIKTNLILVSESVFICIPDLIDLVYLLITTKMIFRTQIITFNMFYSDNIVVFIFKKF